MNRTILTITVKEEVSITEAELTIVQVTCSLGGKAEAIRFIQYQYGIDLQRAISIVTAIIE